MTKRTLLTGLLVSSSLLVAGAVAGQTVTVTISADVVDVDWETATIEDLPGPDGEISFSEAMIATNNTPGHQTVGFAIPQDDWILQFLHPGCAVLHTVTGFFFQSNDTITIDGTTQTDFTGDTNPDGWEVVIYGTDLSLNGAKSTLTGFHSTSVTVTGSNGVVEGNTGTMNITLFGGSGSVVEGNTGGTIKIDRSSDNVVIGNTVQRVRVHGFGSNEPAANNRIGGPDPGDRNFITGYGTWNSEGMPAGTTVQLFDTVNTTIENNSIGTTPDGLAQGSLASTIGIGFEGDNRDTVIRDNRIAGILGHGQLPHHAGQLFGWTILMGGTGDGVDIVGNTIGMDANGAPLLGSVWGIDVGNVITSPADISNVRIGGTSPGDGNVIAGHIFNGITVGHDVPQVRLSGNAVFANGWLGIDLIPSGFGYGVSPNDPLDADDGGNGLQNFPDLESATQECGSLHVVGALHTAPASEFSVEFFASPACDDSGFGEGQTFLGAATVTTDGMGDTAFDVLLPGSVDEGWVITATATLEPLGATSEFSSCIEVLVEAVTGDLDGDGVVGTGDLLALLAAWGQCGDPCPADLDGNGAVSTADLLILLAAWGSCA
jgi:hypothetical protein